MLIEERKSLLRTFDEWKTTLIQDMADIRRMQGICTILELLRLFQRIPIIGRHCYQMEEELSMLELHTLKRDFEISEPQWRSYKAVFVEKASSRRSIFLKMAFLSQVLCKKSEQYSLFYSQLAQCKR